MFGSRSDTAAVIALAYTFGRHTSVHQTFEVVVCIHVDSVFEEKLRALDVHVIRYPHAEVCSADDYAHIRTMHLAMAAHFNQHQQVVFIHPHSIVTQPIKITDATLFEHDLDHLILTGKLTPTTLYIVPPPSASVSSASTADGSSNAVPISFTFHDAVLAERGLSEKEVVKDQARLQSRVHMASVVRYSKRSLPWKYFYDRVNEHKNDVYLDYVHRWVQTEREVTRVLQSKGLVDKDAKLDEWQNKEHFDVMCSNFSFVKQQEKDCGGRVSVMISTYSKEREDALAQLIGHYESLSIVYEVLVVWNDPRPASQQRMASFSERFRNKAGRVKFLLQKVR